MTGRVIEHVWLDKVMAQISGVFHDEWTLEWEETEAEAYNQKHGSCVRCTYRFVWNDELGFQERKLPVDEGPILMKLIKNAARGAGARLVQTKNAAGQHDFCDWGWVDEEVALMWIFLDSVEAKNRCKKPAEM